MYEVWRVWKRDGSRNLMPLREAVRNLRQHYPRSALGELARMLLAGSSIDTRHACFELAT